MGMFDWVHCEYPLPGLADPASIEFQTKSTDCLMDRYRITKEGRLMQEIVRYEDHSDPTKKGLEGLVGLMTPISEGERDTHFHGWFYFYGTTRPEKDTEESEWFEYQAKFTDGQLVTVERIAGPR